MPLPTTRLPLPIIHINGLPGTGKLTIARALISLINRTFQEGWERERRRQQDHMETNGTTVITAEAPQASSPSNSIEAEAGTSKAPRDAKLIHNHLMIDPAGACLPRSSPAYQRLRCAIRAAVFDTLVTAEDTFNTLYVFTDFQSRDELGSSVVREYLAMAQARASKMVPIIISCEEKENLQRLTTAERGIHGKLVDVDLLRTIRQSEKGVFRFEGEEATKLRQIEIDVTDLAVEEAAAVILKHVLEVCPELNAWDLLA